MRRLLAPLTFVLLSSVAHAQSYSSVWNLGDSLSDTGRTYNRTKYTYFFKAPVGDLYHDGRFSNGRVWVEYLNDLNNLTYDSDRNLAWGGAVTGPARNIGYSAMIRHLEEQVDEHFRPMIDGKTSGFLGTIGGWFSSPKIDAKNFGPNPLVTLWIGGNNFRQEVENWDWHSAWYWSEQNFDTPKNTILANVPRNLRNINDTFLSRKDVGQNGVTYYVPTVPDVSTTPKFSGESDDLRGSLGQAVKATNRALKRTLYQLEDEFIEKKACTRIVVIDAAALLAEVQDNPLPFGFKNAKQNCVDAVSGKYTDGCSATNVTDFLFWDQFHPTTKAHEMIAQYAHNTDRLESGRDVSLTVPYVANIEIRDRTFAGSIGGSAALFKKGESTLTLSGNNTYAGGTRIDNGTIRVAKDSNLGAVTGLLTLRGGALSNSQSFTMSRDVRVDTTVSKGEIGGSTFGGTFKTDAGTVLTLQGNTLSGTGDIAKTGAGTLDLRSTMADGRALTEVQQGTLKVNTTNAYRSSEVHVTANGTLGGSGTIVGTVTNAGEVAPGNSIGTLSIDGDYVQHDAGHLVLEADTDRIDSFHVTGVMALDGKIRMAYDPSDKLSGQRFTFATTDGGIQGQYDEVTDLSPFLSQHLHYSPTFIEMSFVRDFRAAAMTRNQNAMADYLNAAYSTRPQGDLDNVFFALDHTGTQAAGAAALDALSGSVLGNVGRADALQRGQFVRAIEDRMADSRSGRGAGLIGGASGATIGMDSAGVGSTLQQVAGYAAGAGTAGGPSGNTALWARVLGGPGQVGGANGFDLTGAGVLLGADTRLGSGLAGFSFGYGNATTETKDGLTRTNADAYQLSLYGSMNAGNLFIDGTAAYTYLDYSTSRGLDFGGLSRVAAGTPNGHNLSVAVKAGARLNLANWNVEPSLGLDWYRLHRNGFLETGAGAASLAVAGEGQDLVLPSVGIRLSHSFDAGSLTLSPEIRARYYRNVGDLDSTITAALEGIGGTPFTVTAAGLGQDIGVIGAGLTARHGENLSLYAHYDATLSSDVTAHTFSAGLKITW